MCSMVLIRILSQESTRYLYVVWAQSIEKEVRTEETERCRQGLMLSHYYTPTSEGWRAYIRVILSLMVLLASLLPWIVVQITFIVWGRLQWCNVYKHDDLSFQVPGEQFSMEDTGELAMYKYALRRVLKEQIQFLVGLALYRSLLIIH